MNNRIIRLPALVACLLSTATISAAADTPTFLKVGSIYRITPLETAAHIPRVLKIVADGGAGWFLVEFPTNPNPIIGNDGKAIENNDFTQRYLNFACVVTANEEKDWPVKKTAAAKSTDESRRRGRAISGKDAAPADGNNGN